MSGIGSGVVGIVIMIEFVGTEVALLALLSESLTIDMEKQSS